MTRSGGRGVRRSAPGIVSSSRKNWASTLASLGEEGCFLDLPWIGSNGTVETSSYWLSRAVCCSTVQVLRISVLRMWSEVQLGIVICQCLSPSFVINDRQAINNPTSLNVTRIRIVVGAYITTHTLRANSSTAQNSTPHPSPIGLAAPAHRTGPKPHTALSAPNAPHWNFRHSLRCPPAPTNIHPTTTNPNRSKLPRETRRFDSVPSSFFIVSSPVTFRTMSSFEPVVSSFPAPSLEDW